MSTANLDIQAALDKHLLAYQSTDVAFENDDYKKTPGTPFLRASILIGEPEIAALGESGKNRQRGIYQIDVNYPAGDGAGDAVVKADALITHFKRGLSLAENGIWVRVKKSWRSPSLTQRPWYKIPVNVSFFADTPNE